MIAVRKVLALSAALGLLAASTARAVPPEPVEVRLLRTVHLGALQGLSEADLGRLSGPGESSYARSVLSRAALLVLGKPGPAPGLPVETLLDQALEQLKPGNDLFPSPPGFGGDDMVYTLTYALAVSGRGAAAERVLQSHVGSGSRLKRAVAMQALHNIGSVHAQAVIQKATEAPDLAFEATTLLVADQFPPLAELAAHWNDFPLAERSRAELAREAGNGCTSRAIMALILSGYLPPAATPAEERRELDTLFRAATEPVGGCFNARIFALRSYGLRTRGAPAVWSSLLARLETGWQRALAARIGFARFPEKFVPAALDRLAVEPEQHVQWELLWGTVLAGKGVVFRDFWDLWNLSPHFQLRLSFPGSFPHLSAAEQDLLLDWLESGRRPGDGQVFDWLLCEIARGARGPEAFRLLRAFFARPAAERQAWVLGDLTEPAALPVLRWLRDHLPAADRDYLANGIGILESGSANLYSGRSPEICCSPTRECLLSQYERQVFRTPGLPLKDEKAVQDWIAAGLKAKPAVTFLDELGRVAEVRDGRGPRPLHFEHLYGCWRLVEP